MVTTIRISLSWGSPPYPNLPAGVHNVAEIMPLVLATHGLKMSDDDAEQVSVASTATDFELMMAALEAALESALAS